MNEKGSFHSIFKYLYRRQFSNSPLKHCYRNSVIKLAKNERILIGEKDANRMILLLQHIL